MESENNTRLAADQCYKLLKGGPTTAERIHATVACMTTPGKFTTEEVALIIQLIRYRLRADAL
jgi:hypothetical protein